MARLSRVAPALGVLYGLLAGRMVNTQRGIRGQDGEPDSGNERLESFPDNLPGIAFRCRFARDWPAEFFSVGCRELCGYSREEFETQGVFWGDLVHPGDRERLWRNVEESLAGNGVFESEYRVSTKDREEKWVWTRGRVTDPRGDLPASPPGNAEDSRWIEGVIIDVTEKREAQAHFQETQLAANKLRDRLAQVDRMAILGLIADGMAHGINQPLSAISMYAQTCLHLNRQTPPRTEMLDSVLEKLSAQTHRAADIVERMRWLGKQTESRFVDADCNELIADVAQLASNEARLLGIEVDVDFYAGACVCNCIPVQVQQVALHLLRNAMSAMLATGCSKGNQVRVGTRRADGRFVVSVADSGTPVSGQMELDLFKPFTSDSATTETSLGLSICSAIITAHGGIMNYSSNEMGGATLWFALPLVEFSPA